MRGVVLAVLATCLMAQEGVISWRVFGDRGSASTIRAVDIAQAYTYLNRLRQRAGMVPLKISTPLEIAAHNHSAYMTKNNSVGHQEQKDDPGFTGVTPWDRAIYAGYLSRMVLENISYGDGSAKESIDSLMSALYHRFAFLDETIDEIGGGYSFDRAFYYQSAYTYDMGNSKLNFLCSDAYPSFSGAGYYTYGVCKEYNKRISKDEYDNAIGSIAGKNPAIILWPYDGASDIPPVFYEESPDPLPECSVSGYPVSVKFNSYKILGQPQVVEFALFDGETKIENVKLLTHTSDPNQKLSPYEFALFPLQRLKWNHSYKALFRYILDGEEHTLLWEFQTRELPYSTYVVTPNTTTLKIRSGKWYALYFKPQDCNDRLGSISYRYSSSIEKVDVLYYDLNTLLVFVQGDVGREVELEVGNRAIVLKIAQEDSTQKEDSEAFPSVDSSSQSSLSKKEQICQEQGGRWVDGACVMEQELEIVKEIADKTFKIAGYFAHYSNDDPYGWLYLNASGSLLAKLEGMDRQGFLQWTILSEQLGYRFDGSSIILTKAKPKASSIALQLQNRVVPVAGYFIYYGSRQRYEPYSWIYVDRSLRVVAKLDGLEPSGELKWRLLHSYVKAKKIEDSITFVPKL